MTGRTARIADALRIAEGTLEGEINAIRRVGSFAGNRVYRVRTNTEAIFVKLAGAADINREVSVLRVLAGRQIPVPEILAASADGVPHLVTREVAGQPLAAEDTGALRGVLEVVHSVRVHGFGLVQGGADGRLSAPHETWFDVMVDRASCADDVVDAGLLDEGLYRRVLASVQAHRGELVAVTDPQLLHGDLTPRHVYADGADITAIIDWGDASAGDPLWDTARLVHAAVPAHGIDRSLELAALASHQASMTRQTLLLTYATVFTLWSMHGELTSGDPYEPWFPAQQQVLTTLLEGIDGR